jgi:hypothetical protein
MQGTPRRLLASLTALLIMSAGFAVAPASAAAPLPASPTLSAPVAVSAPVGVLAPGALLVLAAKRPPKVTVPSRYVYKPKLGARHDYCTFAPDEFPAPRAVNADFRGPCARHDLCYDGDTSRKKCDKALRRNLFRNCEHYYGRYNPLRTACKVAAVTYWAAVVAA